MSLNLNDDYADGIPDGPTRDEIEDAVLSFDDANNGWSATVEFNRHGDYVIGVDSPERFQNREFETLWEFQSWAQRQELAADIALGESSTGIDQAWLTASRVLEGVSA